MEKTLCIFPYLLLADLKGFLNLCKFIFQNLAIFLEKNEPLSVLRSEKIKKNEKNKKRKKRGENR